MANAKAVSICPRCQEELPQPRPAVCPNPACLHILAAPENAHFESPDYLYYQLADKLYPFESPDRKTPALTVAEEKEQAEIQSAYRRWGQDAPLSDRLAALRDAQHLLAWLLHANLSEVGSSESVSVIVKTAIGIGELAKAVDAYYLNGGASGVLESRPVPTRRSDADRRAEGTP